MSRITGLDRITPGSIRIILLGMTGRNKDRIGLAPLGAIRNPVRRSAPNAVSTPTRRRRLTAWPPVEKRAGRTHAEFSNLGPFCLFGGFIRLEQIKAYSEPPNWLRHHVIVEWLVDDQLSERAVAATVLLQVGLDPRRRLRSP